ncbi:MAG: DUF3244 domain-containing protein [Bacteroidales bacterium]|jgi:hypothetical protein|nr:DUF3244 domain-containing protein [Bacteroidales bacterium]
MRKSIYFVLLLITLFSTHAYAEKQIPVTGEWANERIRSFIPAHPIVYISNNVLSVCLLDPLENLNIEITDSNGLIVYQDCISSNGSGYTYTIWLNEQPGYYTIAITHSLGYLSGSFSIE